MQNTNNELVSVIVPVYKVEPYLDRCVASILAQTYPNLEVILVDDGSPDNCPALCDAWAQRDARIRVIHKKTAANPMPGMRDWMRHPVRTSPLLTAMITLQKISSRPFMICSMSTTPIFLPSIGNSSMLTRRRSLLRFLPETLRSFRVLMPSGSFLRRIPTHVMHGINYANGNCLTPSGFRSVVLWKILALHTRSCSTQGRSCTRTNPCITIISAMAALSIQTV